MIRRVADRVILADGWARALIAFASGAVGALAMPPFGFWPALIVSFSVAVWLLDGSAGMPAPGGGRVAAFRASLGRAALAGWCWGFGYFVAGLWWIGSAFLVEADVFAWLMPFGVLGLPAVLAVFFAIGFALARALWSRGAGRYFALAFALTVSEWLRGHVLTGFPWNVLGLAFGQNLWLMQAASLVGLYGLTLWTVLILSAPAALATGETAKARLVPVSLGSLALLAIAAWGAWRVSGPAIPTVAGVKLRIVQPMVAQDDKFQASAGQAILTHYLSLSDRSTSPESTGIADVTHVIWPESAFPFLLHREPNALAAIAAALPRGAVLITGAARQGEPMPGEEGGRFYNSIQAVGSDGAIAATYDKIHLVPFGEYVPQALDAALRRIGIREMVHIPGGFTPGTRRAPFRVAGLPPAAPAVCYEAIFPDEVLVDGARPGYILNVTNDGWFGDTPGPRQHFAQARLRAVEQGLPLVRAANTGISAVVDPLGRIVAALPVGQEGVLDSGLPEPTAVTLFARHGLMVPLIICLLCGLIAAAAHRREF